MLVKICFWLHRVPGLLNTVWDLDFPRRVYSWVLRVETILLSSRGGEGLGLTEDAEDGRRMRKRMDAQQSHPRIWGGGGADKPQFRLENDGAILYQGQAFL